ncbi:MAG: hypothetical protein UU73_C0001G0135 [Candidatus Daviesbacteria bacterium GW2011_GWA1_41_61]|uniref:Methyltransferase type 11 domain-containing protein n=1 Tax=Candidatus Daviesbacteria bacterium GW2011_GWA2_40_9 TaxID=1618424 RepID=A0A0G0U1N7_9BACT|nr:MAG: hypothetical protein UU26_C0001G0030 [Candidatus Daviesbacteria bacterium GW2011_GWC1_40_9]KKR83029.1 MAG: hypothetical protein UU29_C0008G0138 [Candidatus Daviesbacteria bacterium GW2011_GWA2_40_9]KKR92954.1 MAG: hypothetical protein UU44_C0004G0136 [Candidatus Daviesbacteria bacterium GW2011_GWB1_41_15]KKS15498.1 MAG: hypothetical protein UU73_C0001G0135 [Candidatus Daviesbacteria bacterium GW2011_GWA1_41_61]
MNKPKQKTLNQIWQQVPPNYYHQGVTKNLLQWIWHTSKIKAFKQIVQQKKFIKILDVGCSGGFMTSKVAEIFPRSQVFAIDAYPDAINYAKSRFPHINFQVADAHHLPFPEDSFDLIICYETIEHVLNPQKILQQMRRVVKKNGTVIVAMDSGNLMFKTTWWAWEKTFGRVWQGAHLHPFHHQDLEKIIRQADFKITKKHFSHLGMEVSFVLKK